MTRCNDCLIPIPGIVDVLGAGAFISSTTMLRPTCLFGTKSGRFGFAFLMDARFGVPARIVRDWLSENRLKAAETWARYHS